MSPLAYADLLVDKFIPAQAYEQIQFWLSMFVFGAGILQLDFDRKLMWPAMPGRLTVWGYQLGIKASSPALALRFGDAGLFLDKAATLLGRLGAAGLSIVALFAWVDSLYSLDGPRPLFTWLLMCVAPIQFRALTKSLISTGIIQLEPVTEDLLSPMAESNGREKRKHQDEERRRIRGD